MHNRKLTHYPPGDVKAGRIVATRWDASARRRCRKKKKEGTVRRAPWIGWCGCEGWRCRNQDGLGWPQETGLGW